MARVVDLIKKSIGASLLVALGNFALLKIGSPIGPILFSLGLLGVCYMGLNLFTGKCGFIIEDKIKVLDIVVILLVNLISGYLFGLLLSILDTTVVSNAIEKVATWEFSFAFFIKSLMCGVIMFIAVYLYRKGTVLGILLGIPMFIFCGFQHCIANIITLGIASTFDWSIILAILGNFLGSLIVWLIAKDRVKT